MKVSDKLNQDNKDAEIEAISKSVGSIRLKQLIDKYAFTYSDSKIGEEFERAHMGMDKQLYDYVMDLNIVYRDIPLVFPEAILSNPYESALDCIKLLMEIYAHVDHRYRQVYSNKNKEDLLRKPIRNDDANGYTTLDVLMNTHLWIYVITRYSIFSGGSQDGSFTIRKVSDMLNNRIYPLIENRMDRIIELESIIEFGKRWAPTMKRETTWKKEVWGDKLEEVPVEMPPERYSAYIMYGILLIIGILTSVYITALCLSRDDWVNVTFAYIGLTTPINGVFVYFTRKRLEFTLTYYNPPVIKMTWELACWMCICGYQGELRAYNRTQHSDDVLCRCYHGNKRTLLCDLCCC